VIEYRSYTPADRSAVLRVLGEGMTAPQAAAKAATFDWQFGRNPHDNGRSPFLLGIADGAVVAVQGFLPAKLLHKGTRKTGVWAVDACVLVPFRRRGISTEMKRRLLKEADVGVGYGDATNSILRSLGWQLSDSVGTYYFHVNEGGALGALKNLRTRLYRRPIRRGGSTDVVVESKPDFGPEVDALWELSRQRGWIHSACGDHSPQLRACRRTGGRHRCLPLFAVMSRLLIRCGLAVGGIVFALAIVKATLRLMPAASALLRLAAKHAAILFGNCRP